MGANESENEMNGQTYTQADMARAWAEGAETAWTTTGEGWNGEYAGEYRTHDGMVSFAEANDDVPNPYGQVDA